MFLSGIRTSINHVPEGNRGPTKKIGRVGSGCNCNPAPFASLFLDSNAKIVASSAQLEISLCL